MTPLPPIFRPVLYTISPEDFYNRLTVKRTASRDYYPSGCCAVAETRQNRTSSGWTSDKPEVLAELRDFAMNEKETTAQEQLTRPIGQEISKNNLRAYISKVYTKNKCT